MTPARLIDPVATARGTDTIQSAVEPAHSKLALTVEEPAGFHAFRENINKNRPYVEGERVYVEGERVYAACEHAYAACEHAYAEGQRAYAEIEQGYVACEHVNAEGEHAYVEGEHIGLAQKVDEVEIGSSIVSQVGKGAAPVPGYRGFLKGKTTAGVNRPSQPEKLFDARLPPAFFCGKAEHAVWVPTRSHPKRRRRCALPHSK